MVESFEPRHPEADRERVVTERLLANLAAITCAASRPAAAKLAPKAFATVLNAALIAFQFEARDSHQQHGHRRPAQQWNLPTSQEPRQARGHFREPVPDRVQHLRVARSFHVGCLIRKNLTGY